MSSPSSSITSAPSSSATIAEVMLELGEDMDDVWADEDEVDVGWNGL
jgi:hypothetical protein